MLLLVLMSAMIISSSALNINDNSIDLVKSGLSEYGIDIEDIGQNNNDWSQNRAFDGIVNAILGSIINNLLDTYSFTVLESPKIITFNSPLGLNIRGFIAIEEGSLFELVNPAITAKFSNNLSALDLSISMEKFILNSKYQCKYRYGDENDYTSKSGVANLLLQNSSFSSQLNLTVDLSMNNFTINSITIYDVPFDLELESIKIDVTGIIENELLNSLILDIIESGILTVVDLLKDPTINEQVEKVIVSVLNAIFDNLFSSSEKSEQLLGFVELFYSYFNISN